MANIHPELNWFWATVWLIVSLLFVALCGLIKTSARFNTLDQRWQQRLFAQSDHWWWQAIAAVFDPKTLVVWDFALAGLLLCLGRPARAIYVLAALGTLDAFGIWVKHHVKRTRPTTFAKGTTTYSFPSGHTLGTTMLALMMTMLFANPFLNGLALLLWLLVIICRLRLQAHYPADVCGAVLLAISWWIGTEWLFLLIMR
ncbi:phosphatase PAP2 family protein [Limosilactobacillus caecicola]|uniref:phosphatase PAP2 family protein n=1 Tax=Limosilactobacillus caecicola TaxID=2941332 RepID=UPI00203DD5C3|nr:phosphatase PAP2 family protein [Limosilactobacillus caecicola]